jgi:1-acyl-sn-glycerol-3-phosphate acyltransferase
MGGMTPTSWATRATRATRLAFELGRTWQRARQRAAVIGSESWRRLVEDASVRLLAALAVDVRVRGARPLVAGPVLLVANHVSWLDVQALGATAGTRFVAKSEVRDWPVVGALAARLGTVFIRRRSLRDAARVKDVLTGLLVTGERIVVFPEGTTTDGSRVAPFYAALLQAAVDAAITVQPVAIRYCEADGAPSPAAAFVDDMSFGSSLARVLTRPRLVAELTFGPPIWAADQSRRALAARCREFIARELGLDEPIPEPMIALPVRRAA